MDRHDLDVISLVFGALFVALGLTYLGGYVPLVDIDGRYVWPAVLIGLGVSLLLSLRRSVGTVGPDPDADDAPTG
jgi:hypothetical protein